MDHSYYKDRVSAWIDQELPPYEQEALTQHIAECEECRALADKLRQVDKLIDERSAIGGSDDYWEELARKTEARIGINQESNVTSITRTAKSSDSGLRWKIVAVAASISVLTFVGWHQQDIFKDIFNEEAAPASTEFRNATPAIDSDSVGFLSPEEPVLQETQPAAKDPKEMREEMAPPTVKPENLLNGVSADQSVTIKRAAPAPSVASDAEVEVEGALVPTPAETDEVAGRDDRARVVEKKVEATTKDLRDNLLSKSAQLKPQSLAKPDAIELSELETADFGSDREAQLVFWQGMRDSLLDIYAIEDSLIGGKRKSTYEQAQSATASVRPDSLIAECLFNVARFSNDEAELEECLRQLTVMGRQDTQNTAVQRNLQNVQQLQNVQELKK